MPRKLFTRTSLCFQKQNPMPLIINAEPKPVVYKLKNRLSFPNRLVIKIRVCALTAVQAVAYLLCAFFCVVPYRGLNDAAGIRLLNSRSCYY